MANESEKNTATLRMYVNDMLALQKHILEAVERQCDDENVRHAAEASQLISHVKSTLVQQVAELQTQVERLGSTTGAAIKEAISHTLGVLAGLYDKVRKDPVSRMIRDDYTALNMSSISYTQLHTTGLAYGDHVVADLALRHLEALAPLIIRHNEVVPKVVAAELADEGTDVDTTVGIEATENTQQAWKA